MFDITADDIQQLNDIDLRELVGRLCEAELVSLGLSAAAVTWGGNQTAADGGLDVRVALPADVFIEGLVPRPSTGFQVKTPDMARAALLAEMRPSRQIRPVIQELADAAGAYVMVSSKGSTTDSALRSRRNAMREALDGVANANQLQTDFYDRTRLATWVRRHPGLITWVKERIGKAVVGWRPYGPWSGAAEGMDAEYLLDDKLRVHLGTRRDVPARSAADAIDELRDELARPGKIVRLVGLSGVGKTRLVQALFDARIGSRPLPPSRAVVDARTIAEASGGNARIAIALAQTVERSDTIAGLSNDELFQRLFRQRQDADGALLLAAQACSLVYSFNGEALAGGGAELPRLAALAGQTASET